MNICPPKNKHKYCNVKLCMNNTMHSFDVHRLVAKYFVDGYFDGAVVNHKDGNNRNNNASNLEWVTQKENIHQSYVDSGVGATRNYVWWTLKDPQGIVLGVFQGSGKMKDYVRANNLEASPTSLEKYHTSKGYVVETISKQARSCNDYQ